jgi:hypothetical protein
MRFTAPDIDRLLEIAWWDWPPERVARAIPALATGGVAALTRA